jgi:hypothetical protein
MSLQPAAALRLAPTLRALAVEAIDGRRSIAAITQGLAGSASARRTRREQARHLFQRLWRCSTLRQSDGRPIFRE